MAPSKILTPAVFLLAASLCLAQSREPDESWLMQNSGFARPPAPALSTSAQAVANSRLISALTSRSRPLQVLFALPAQSVQPDPALLLAASQFESTRVPSPFAMGGLLYAAAQAGRGQGPQGVPRAQGQNPNGMHIYIWAGLKSHGEGQHDYPQFLADWSKLLTEHGAVVDGALHGPSSADLEHTDVVVIYKGDAAYLSDSEKAALEEFIKRGGGLVSFHDSLCGPDPAYFATLVGGAKKHGQVNYTLDAPIPYTVVDKSNPIMADMSDITISDEAFFDMTWAKDPGIHVLATAKIPPTRSAGDHKGEVVPQIWTYEHELPGGQPARAFVWMQGHTYANYSNYQIQHMLLRGIAWAGKKPVDELVNYVAPPRPGRGGTFPAGRGGN
jgi:type 1 glutamine amidotransferase